MACYGGDCFSQDRGFDQPEKDRDVFIPDVIATEGDDLIESGHGVPKTAAARVGNLFQRPRADPDVLSTGDLAQAVEYQRIRYEFEVVLLAP